MNDMVDMTKFVEAKSDQLNADDLIGTTPVNGRIITVRKVTGTEGDQPISVYFDGDNNKPFKPCKTMRRVLLGVWGRYAQDYVGRQMMLYRDDEVTFGGLAVGGIRISQMSHIDKDTVIVVAKTKGKKAGIKISPLRAQQQARSSASAPDARILETARAKARAGTDTFTAWWNSDDGKAARPAVRPIMDEIKALCAEADAADDPFTNDGTYDAEENPTAAEGPADEQRGEDGRAGVALIVAGLE